MSKGHQWRSTVKGGIKSFTWCCENLKPNYMWEKIQAKLEILKFFMLLMCNEKAEIQSRV